MGKKMNDECMNEAKIPDSSTCTHVPSTWGWDGMGMETEMQCDRFLMTELSRARSGQRHVRISSFSHLPHFTYYLRYLYLRYT